ncbi:hypothetical protein [Burkholderia contaminans]|uniref:Uncharacterized protein n=1 Tax=Burkholderia contaminans TaxID=488447 RepID=A0A3N8QUK7_9BURK|nr:hypothetical protein [Burkholderia contaminans]RQT27444.1 hypothetical protein DF037_18100 [Burkholderia contaminans]
MNASEVAGSGDDRSGEQVQGVEKYFVPVKAGCSDERVVELREGESITKILEVISTERGRAITELVLVREGEDELSGAGLVDAQYPHRRRHHVHYAGAVAVTVYYQAGEHRREFKRHASVEEVLIWAIGAFNIDPSMATEFELARRGQTEELPTTEHIGHLAGHHHELELDLVRGDIANGGSRDC